MFGWAGTVMVFETLFLCWIPVYGMRIEAKSLLADSWKCERGRLHESELSGSEGVSGVSCLGQIVLG